MLLRNVVDGALAGFVATAPMSILMETASSLAPDKERARLPPRQITQTVGRRTGVWAQLNETEKQAATLLAHFAFGAAAGAAYGAVVARAAHRGSIGRFYGLAVWSTFYLGVLPALGMRPSALREPLWRSGTMIAAHWIWGAALARALDAKNGNAVLNFTGIQNSSHAQANARATG